MKNPLLYRSDSAGEQSGGARESRKKWGYVSQFRVEDRIKPAEPATFGRAQLERGLGTPFDEDSNDICRRFVKISSNSFSDSLTIW